MNSWRDSDIERLLAEVAPRVQQGQQRVADLTDAYLARIVTEQGLTPRSSPLAATTTELRGVSDETLYARPIATMHDTLAKGGTVTSAVAAGGRRLASIVETNMQLAKTHSARRSMSRAGVNAYERVLTGRENCALCVIASTQRYWVADLSPMHPACDCGVRPLKGDPSEQVIHPDRLEAIHNAVEAQFGGSDRGARYIDGSNSVSDYLDLISVRTNSELGPVLTWRDQHFTGADDLPS
ncbi:hypothetical protein P2P98_03130 [Microbacterium sp. Kw_RZR3]|uniref:hypothetical protein n=1 Tax=Microbacterium sp. Kw_RZR3 TaxID=3032903 RepID=UPI0023DC85FE|nr:hypothetical protein [Microbacterium sp. Kw_RZR3]MDF2045142.1 hypothetical protein [Microbacterium sp. Kw_RZR3]